MSILKEILCSLEITQQEVADKLNIKSLSTANLKINGKYDFTTTEAKKLKELINSKSKKKYSIEEIFDAGHQT